MLFYKKEEISNPKLTVGIDLDGTSGDFHASFRDVLMDHQGIEIPASIPEVYSYVEAGYFKDFDTFLKALHAATHQRVYFNMAPYVGFKEEMERLYELGIELKIVTTRPENALDDTVSWLEDVARVPYHSISITEDKVKAPADIYFDDMPGHIDNFRKNNREGIIFHQPYNADISGDRVHSWAEIGNLLAEKVR